MSKWSARWLLLVVLSLVVAGCSRGVPEDRRAEPTDESSIPLKKQKKTPALTMSETKFELGEPIDVSFKNFPTNKFSRVVISKANGSPTSSLAVKFTKGHSSGKLTFKNIPLGKYVARGYGSHGWKPIAKSKTFFVGAAVATPTVTVDKSIYEPGESAIVTYANLMGTATDWVSIAPVGSSPTTFSRWSYTNGTPNGSVTLSLADLAPGNYVARAYFQNSFAIADESEPFQLNGSVGAATLTTDQSAYDPGEPIVVSFTNTAGNANDWVAIAPQGAPNTTFSAWSYTSGVVNGSITFNNTLANGTYVARLFYNNSFNVEVESAPFTVDSATMVMTDAASYTPTQTVTVNYAGAPGNQDWIAIAPATPGSPVTKWVYTPGGPSGVVNFTLGDVPFGTYEARLYTNDAYVLLATSAPFTVTNDAISVSPTKPIYTPSENITIAYQGMPNAGGDWISIAPMSDPTGPYVAWTYVTGTAGVASLAPLPAGAYVARAHFNNQFTIEATSAPFTVGTPPGPGLELASITYQNTAANFPSYAWDYQAPISADGRFVVFYSYASDMAAGDDNGVADVFLRDRTAGTTTRITTGAGESTALGISPDGRYLVFFTTAPDTFVTTTYVYDRDTATETAIGTDGAISFHQYFAFSNNGQYLVYMRYDRDTSIPDVFQETSNVCIRTLATGTTTCPFTAVRQVDLLTGFMTGDSLFEPRVANDGVTAAYRRTNNATGINTIEVANESSATPIANGFGLSISADARYVVYTDATGVAVQRFDRVLGTTVRVDTDAFGNPGDSSNYAPRVDASGRYVAFNSFSSNLVPGDVNGNVDLFVKDLDTNSITRVSSVSGQFITGFAANAGYVTVSSFDPLLPVDTNMWDDVYVAPVAP